MNLPDTPDESFEESLIYEIDLDAAIDKVWHALTDPQLVALWMLPAANEPDLEIHLQIADCQPPHWVTYRWRATDEPESLVTFELSTVGRRTHLRLTHRRAVSSHGTVMMLKAA